MPSPSLSLAPSSPVHMSTAMSGAVSGLSAAPSGRPSLALTESGSIWPLASAASLALSALTHRCDLRDGRQLAYRFYGVPLGQARAVCIYHHGIPASLVEAEPLGAAAEAAGVALVAFDRSGMGESTFNPRMTMQTVIDDARQLQDALGLPAAVHVGESGGAPYAACFAATHPRRCAALLLLAGLAATHGSDGARLRRGLNSMDRICFNIGAVAGPLNRFIKLAADRMPGSVKRGAGGSLGPCDASYLAGNDGAKEWIVSFMQRTYKQGVQGVLRDYKVLGSDWGVDVSAVACPAAIWHGGGDRVVPPAHAQWWAGVLPGARLHVVEREGHISLVGRHAAAIMADLLAILEEQAAAAAVAAAGEEEVAADEEASAAGKDHQQQQQEPASPVPPQQQQETGKEEEEPGGDEEQEAQQSQQRSPTPPPQQQQESGQKREREEEAA